MSDAPYPTTRWLGPFDLRDFMGPSESAPIASALPAAIEQGGVYAWYDREKQEFAYFGRSYSSIRKRQLQHLAAQAGLVQSHHHGPKHIHQWSIDWTKSETKNAYRDVNLFVEHVRRAFRYLDAIDVWVFPMAPDREFIKNAERLLLAEIKPYGTNTMGAVDIDLSPLREALLEIKHLAPASKKKKSAQPPALI